MILEVDQDLYPTEDSLERLGEALGNAVGEELRLLVIQELEVAVEKLSPYSQMTIEDGRYRFTTGGWSGCEEFIGELNRVPLVQGLFLEKWERGGAWTYDLRQQKE